MGGLNRSRRGSCPRPKQAQTVTITQSHPHAYTYKHSHPRTQRKDKQQWMSYTHSHSQYILYTARSRCRYPIGATGPRAQEVVPFPPGVKTGKPLQHQPRLVPATPNLSPKPDLPPQPQSLTTPILIQRGGHVQKRGLPRAYKSTNQNRHRMTQSQQPN
ncbi:hypothetical protein GOODEAATRI_014320 [Goodea atripinnis]|uniref:Uncharacterized protein n=1 Tax=Goodea atripinnis TaxID=208336 RepID=A0ABV0N1C4_9TELE